MSWHKELQNSRQSTFWKNWEFYTEGNSTNDTEMLIRLEKNWRLRIFLKLLPSTAWFWFSVHVMSFSDLYSYNQCSLTQRLLRILSPSSNYPKDLIPLLHLWCVLVFSMLLSSSLYRKMTYNFPSLGLALPTSLNFFHMTQSPVSLFKSHANQADLIFPVMGTFLRWGAHKNCPDLTWLSGIWASKCLFKSFLTLARI